LEKLSTSGRNCWRVRVSSWERRTSLKTLPEGASKKSKGRSRSSASGFQQERRSLVWRKVVLLSPSRQKKPLNSIASSSRAHRENSRFTLRSTCTPQ